MVTHSSVLAWRIPGTGEPVGLPSLGSHRVGHDWSDSSSSSSSSSMYNMYFIVALICISLKYNDVHYYLCLFAICIFCLEKSPFEFLVHFLKSWFWSFCFWVVRIPYLFRILNPYQMYEMQFFLPNVSCLFIFLMMFEIQKFSILVKFTLSVFLCYPWFWCQI